MDHNDFELLRALLQGFDRAMLVSRCGERMRSRPTTVANTGDTERLWLLSGVVGDELDEIGQDPNVNVVMQDGIRFCSVTGTARVVRPTGDETIWNDGQRAWLAHGARRSSLVLIEVDLLFAEYWDPAGVRGLRFHAVPRSADESRGGVRPSRERRAAVAPTRDHQDNVITVEKTRWIGTCATSKT